MQTTSAHGTAATRSILLVDDDEDDRALISAAIMRASSRNRVACVTSVEDCFKYLGKTESYQDTRVFPPPVAIITDLRMPLSDGFALIRQLRSDPRYNHIPVLVLSESSCQQDIDEAYELGVTQYIVKPGNFRELTRVCGELVDHWSRIQLQDEQQPAQAPVLLPSGSSSRPH